MTMITTRLIKNRNYDRFLILGRNVWGSKRVRDPAREEVLPEMEYGAKDPHDNIVLGWGMSEHGALGHYIQKRSKMKNKRDMRFWTFKRPLRLSFAEHFKVTQVAAGFGFSVFAVKSKDHNKVFGTGVNTDSQIGYHAPRKDYPLGILLAPVPVGIKFKKPAKTKVTSVGAGRAHTIVCTDIEGVFSLGNNSYGQCGRDIVDNEKYMGSQVIYNIPEFTDEKIVHVECGQDHTLFLTENGSVYACGWGADGQTGLGHYNAQTFPAKVEGDIKGEKIVKISSRSDCVLALNDKGEVFGWGNSEYCQIFKQSDEIQQINRPIHVKKCQNFGKIIDVAAAGSYCMMLNSEGDVFSWGYGILGQGPEAHMSWEPQIIPPILFGRNEFQKDSMVTSIHCGLNHSGVVTNYGSAYMWGVNKGGCLGFGDMNNKYFPLRVAIPTIVKKLALGVDHTLAIGRVHDLKSSKKKKPNETTEATKT